LTSFCVLVQVPGRKLCKRITIIVVKFIPNKLDTPGCALRNKKKNTREPLRLPVMPGCPAQKVSSGHEIAPNTVANATTIIVLATKIQKLVAKLATRTL